MSTKHTYYKNRLSTLFKESPEAKLVENRYRSIRYALHEEYKQVSEVLGKERMIDLIKDCIYLDRKLREMTEGIQTEEKKILSQEWCLANDKPITKADIEQAYETRKEEIESLRKYDKGEKEIKPLKLFN